MSRTEFQPGAGYGEGTPYRLAHTACTVLLIVSLATLLCANATAATIVNLTTAGTSGTIGGAIYEQADPQSTGTGTIDTFVQQQPQGSSDSSKAYNTTENNIFDNKSADTHNHSVLLSAVPIVLRNNTLYREFLLDINENSGSGGNEYISLDEVQVFLGGTANSSVTTFTGGVLDHDGSLVYRMDTAVDDNWVALNYALNSGSGSGDMFLLVPASAFTGLGTQVVTLYSQFGLRGVNPSGVPAGNYGGSDGFEEWALREGILPPPPGGDVPEPSSALLGILVVAATLGIRRRLSLS